jgi:uncharacterized membrane protein
MTWNTKERAEFDESIRVINRNARIIGWFVLPLCFVAVTLALVVLGSLVLR